MKDPDAEAYIHAIGGLGGIQGQAIHSFVAKLKRIGCWHNWIGLYPLLKGKGTNLRHPGRYALQATGSEATIGPLGLTTDGATSAFDTGISPALLNMQGADQVLGQGLSFVIAAYLRVTPSNSTTGRDGCATGTARLEIAPRNADMLQVYYGDQISVAGGPDFYEAGFRCVTRQLGANGGERIIRVKDNTLAGMSHPSPGTAPLDSYCIGATNRDGVITGYWPAQYAFYGIGYGDHGGIMPTTGSHPSAALRGIIEQLLVAMGRHLVVSS